MERLFEIAETENIKVVEDLLPERIHGLYYRKGIKKLICIEKRLEEIKKRIIFAEELGHHFTSFGDNLRLSREDFNTVNSSEHKARKWAAELLIPDFLMENIYCKNKIDINLELLADELKVTSDFLLFRYICWLENKRQL